MRTSYQYRKSHCGDDKMILRPWNFNQNRKIFIEENAFENAVCKMAAMLSHPKCVWLKRSCKILKHLECSGSLQCRSIPDQSSGISQGCVLALYEYHHSTNGWRHGVYKLLEGIIYINFHTYLSCTRNQFCVVFVFLVVNYSYLIQFYYMFWFS